MKRIVTIQIPLDPTEYHRAVDSPKGAVNLVIAMLKGEADLPRALVSCDGTAATEERFSRRFRGNG